MIHRTNADLLLRPRLRRLRDLCRTRQARHVARKRACVAAVLGGGMCLLLSACSNLATMEFDANNAEALRYARSGDLQREVDSLVEPLIDQGVTPGAVVGVLLPDGSTRFFGYGVRDRDGGGRPDGDTLFAVGSLSKGFLGAITDLLVQEGQLSWSDALEKLLPPDTTLSADAKKITLLQLVTHTSGLPRQPYTPEIMIPFLRYLFTGENFYSPLDRVYVLHYLASFTAPSRVEYQYSNIDFGLVGYALEQRTGLSVDALLAQKIVKPLGLRNTGYIPEALPGYATRAHGYAGDQPKFIRRGAPVPDWQFTRLMRGSAALYSTARDLLTFAAAHLKGGGTPFSAALIDTLRVRFSQPDESTAVAWTVEDVDDQRIAYQLGIVAGYTGYLGLDLKHRTAVVVLQNTFNWDESVGGKLLIRLARAQDQWQQGRPVNARLSRQGPTE